MFQSDCTKSSITLKVTICDLQVGATWRSNPYAFTEHGVAMMSSVLNSKRAVQMNILIIRAFIKMRQLLVQNKNLKIDWIKLKIYKNSITKY